VEKEVNKLSLNVFENKLKQKPNLKINKLKEN